MGMQRTHIVLPQQLLKDIDAEVGPRGRSAFLAELATREIRKRRLLKYFADGVPAWKDEDHPELADGADAWIRSLRQDSSQRLEELWGADWFKQDEGAGE